MHKIWKMIGVAAFWVSWPLLWVYLRLNGRRTRVVILAEDHILLVKSWLGSGKWILPGGGVHKGEDVVAAALREVEEETALRLVPTQLEPITEGVADEHGLRFYYSSFVVCLPRRVQLVKQDEELSEAAWLPLESLGTRKDLSPFTRHVVGAFGTK